MSKGPHRRLIVLVAAACAALATEARAQTGGFVDSATAGGLRPRYSSATIQSFLPARGRFTFPSPYNTQAVRLTNASDCGGGRRGGLCPIRHADQRWTLGVDPDAGCSAGPMIGL